MVTVSAEEMRAAQVITGVTIAAFLLSSRLGPRRHQMRAVILGVYLAAAVAMVAYVMIR
jgi:hypothetical protein